jgi:hypothetical protein
VCAIFSTFRIGNLNREQLLTRFEQSAPSYKSLKGLAQKSYWFDDSAGTAGGFYLFESKSSAQEFLDSEQWRVRIPAVWGADPEFDLLEVPLVVRGPGTASVQ